MRKISVNSKKGALSNHSGQSYKSKVNINHKNTLLQHKSNSNFKKMKARKFQKILRQKSDRNFFLRKRKCERLALMKLSQQYPIENQKKFLAKNIPLEMLSSTQKGALNRTIKLKNTVDSLEGRGLRYLARSKSNALSVVDKSNKRSWYGINGFSKQTVRALLTDKVLQDEVEGVRNILNKKRQEEIDEAIKMDRNVRQRYLKESRDRQAGRLKDYYKKRKFIESAFRGGLETEKKAESVQLRSASQDLGTRPTGMGDLDSVDENFFERENSVNHPSSMDLNMKGASSTAKMNESMDNLNPLNKQNFSKISDFGSDRNLQNTSQVGAGSKLENENSAITNLSRFKRSGILELTDKNVNYIQGHIDFRDMHLRDLLMYPTTFPYMNDYLNELRSKLKIQNIDEIVEIPEVFRKKFSGNDSSLHTSVDLDSVFRTTKFGKSPYSRNFLLKKSKKKFKVKNYKAYQSAYKAKRFGDYEDQMKNQSHKKVKNLKYQFFAYF